MDEGDAGCSRVAVSESIREKQNLNVILVPESVLVALSKSTGTGDNDSSKSIIQADPCFDSSVVNSSKLASESPANNIVGHDFENSEFSGSKDATPASGVIVLEGGEEWFVNIDLSKSLKESSQNNQNCEDSTSEAETSPTKHPNEIVKPQNVGNNQHVIPRRREIPKEFKCNVFNCYRKFETDSDLKIHLQSHDKQKIHRCQFPGCPWSFPTPYKLRRHALSHQQTKLHKCNHPGCDVSCSTKYNLKAHQQIHQAEEKSQCSLCNISFNSKLQMLKHQRLKHKKEAVFPCTYENCDKKFHTKSARTIHMRTHQRNKFVCMFGNCKKAFWRPASLKEHILSKHSKIRPFKCDFPGCAWEFTTGTKLKRHMIIHTGVKSWICPFEDCASKFYRKEHLKSHLKMHDRNEKERTIGVDDPDAPIALKLEGMAYYFCPYEDCGSLFTSQIGARQHIQKMHPATSTAQLEPDVPDAMAEGSTPSTSQAIIDAISEAAVCSEKGASADASCTDAGMPSGSILQSLIRADVAAANDTPSLSNDMVSTRTNVPLRQYLTTSSKAVLSHQLSAQSSTIEASHFLVLNANDGDFAANNSSAVQENTGYVNVQNEVYPTQVATSSSEPFFTFTDCVQTIDPNVVMAVKSHAQMREVAEIEQHAGNEGSGDEDIEKQNADTGGSARTDGDAYHKLKIRKQWNSNDSATDVSPEKNSVNPDQSIQEFFLRETGILPTNQLNEKMADCIGGTFEGSTINLGDLE